MHDSLMAWWNGISLRTKITGVTVLMLTLGLLVSGIGTMAMLKPYMVEQVDAQLRAVSQAKDLRVYFDNEGEGGDGLNFVTPRESEFFITVYDDLGSPADHNWKNRPAATYPSLPDSWPLEHTSSINADGTRIMTLPSVDDGDEFRAIALLVTTDSVGTLGTAIVAVSLSDTENILAAYLTIFLGFGVGVVLVGALLTRMLVTSTFTPLREVEQTAAAIADGDFSQRLPGATPNTEVGRLNRSLNTMLSRIDRAFHDRARTIEQMRRFVGDASHELRTPLVSVRGYAELYRMGALQSSDDVAQAMDRIEKEAIRMGGLVEDLLELARLDETKPLNLAPVDLVPLARDAAMDAMASSPGRTVTVVTSTIRRPDQNDGLEETQEIPALELTASGEARERDARGKESHRRPAAVTGSVARATKGLSRLRVRRTRKVEVPSPASGPPLPESGATWSGAVVLAEENKLRQVLTNLMGNAMRFTPPGSPIEIGVVCDEISDQALLEVIDHGEGIPPQIREKIFQRFWRADSSRTRETGGSGLGLAIVSSIVAAHNGTVEVVDTPGGGATFRVVLPLLSLAEPPADTVNAPAREASPDASVASASASASDD